MRGLRGTLSICLVVGALAAPGEPARADSRLPPSNPGAAIRVGMLDQVRDNPFLPWKLLPCVGYDAVIKFNDPYYGAAYFSFGLALPRSRLEIRMREDPQTSLFFRLFDRNLNQIGGDISGGDNEELIREDLPPGEYYVGVLTSSNARRRPDGTNRAFVVLQAQPEGFRRPVETMPRYLGVLGPGQSVTAAGSTIIRQPRTTAFSPAPGNPNCPLGRQGGVVVDLYNEYAAEVPAGRVAVSVTIRSQQNWPNEYPFRTYYLKRGNLGDQWVQIQNGQVAHGGGTLRIRVGAMAPVTITARDAYVDYELAIGAPNAQSPGNSDPTAPAVSDFGPPVRPPTVTIGPIPR